MNLALANAPAYSLGPLIHNSVAVEALEAQGVRVAQTVSDIPAGARAIIRSHGVSREVLNALEGGAHFNGIGISNIHQRLRGKYGQPYGVTIQSRVGYYTLLTVDIPRLDGQGGTDPCIPC